MSDEERTIKMFLPDGDPSGVRIARDSTSAIQAVAFSWDQFQEPGDDLSDFLISERPSVYILIGPKPFQAYVGQTRRGYKRLQNHDFLWTDAVILVSKGLTQGCAEYAESKLMDAVSGSSSWSLPPNRQRPKYDETRLPREERPTARRFVDQAKVLVAALVWDMFRGVGTSSAGGPLFLLEGKGYDAMMVVTSSFRVKKGSKARGEELPSINEGYKSEREKLLEHNILERRKNGSLVFKKDHNFSSLSAAASVITGRNAAGTKEWKLSNDQTYEEWESSNDKQQEDESAAGPLFLLEGKGYNAEMVVTSSFRVKKGSKARGEELPSINEGYKSEREKLLMHSILERRKNGSLVFKKDHNFSSLSAAASVITGRNTAGTTAWKPIAK